jgi:hypothetical protein
MDSVATIATPNGSKYLEQLCKHWGHKLEVEFDPLAGKIAFQTSALHLAASPEALTLTIAGPDAGVLDRMEGVVVEHLGRFSFREPLTIDWVRA